MNNNKLSNRKIIAVIAIILIVIAIGIIIFVLNKDNKNDEVNNGINNIVNNEDEAPEIMEPNFQNPDETTELKTQTE